MADQNLKANSGATGLGTLADAIPQERREQIESLVDDSKSFVTRARTYVVANPLAAAGIAIVAGAAIWALFGTKGGRKVLSAGKSIAPDVSAIIH
jgi:ElaB/YqjD/DUF883 family membrane-anchored ribosome-binding protein